MQTLIFKLITARLTRRTLETVYKQVFKTRRIMFSKALLKSIPTICLGQILT